MSIALVAINLDPSLILDPLIGLSPSSPPKHVERLAPLFLYLTAIILMGRSVYKNFYSYSKLKGDLEKSIANLNNENVHLRTYAIDEILEISRLSRRLHPRAMTALAQYIRLQAPAEPEDGREVTVKKAKFGPAGARVSQKKSEDIHQFAQKQMQRPRKAMPPDIAAALNALSGRRSWFDDPRRWIDLSEANLESANLEGGNFRRFSFAGSNLRHARFDSARLREAQFAGAILNDAFMTGACANDAQFNGVLAHRIHFDGAQLKRADFMGADLYDASLQKADARNASFMMAQMWRVSGGLTDFKGAEFSQADLKGADFRSAKNLERDQILGHEQKNCHCPRD